MSKIYKIFVDVTIDIFRNVGYFIKNNLVTFANILSLIAPYAMYLIGQSVALDREYFAIGGEVAIPLLFIVVIYYLKSAANKIGKGITIPIPEERFTSVDDDGEVSIKQSRIQELILYVADLEDWLAKKGML